MAAQPSESHTGSMLRVGILAPHSGSPLTWWTLDRSTQLTTSHVVPMQIRWRCFFTAGIRALPTPYLLLLVSLIVRPRTKHFLQLVVERNHELLRPRAWCQWQRSSVQARLLIERAGFSHPVFRVQMNLPRAESTSHRKRSTRNLTHWVSLGKPVRQRSSALQDRRQRKRCASQSSFRLPQNLPSSAFQWECAHICLQTSDPGPRCPHLRRFPCRRSAFHLAPMVGVLQRWDLPRFTSPSDQELRCLHTRCTCHGLHHRTLKLSRRRSFGFQWQFQAAAPPEDQRTRCMCHCIQAQNCRPH